MVILFLNNLKTKWLYKLPNIFVMSPRLTPLLIVVVFFSCSTSKDISLKYELDPQERYLILTADDYGASKNINDGIRFAADNNAITAISVLSNFRESLPGLKEISENHEEIGIGIHLNIVTGKPLMGKEKVRSLIDENGNFYTIDKLLPRIKRISLDELRMELNAQIQIMEDHGIPIDHLSDQNGILSYYTPFFELVTELALELDVPVRSPIPASVKYPKVFTNSQMKKRYRSLAFKCAFAAPFVAFDIMKYSKIDAMADKSNKLEELGIRHPDVIVESLWGEPTASNLLHILENLPAGTSEIVLHFGTHAHPDEIPSGLEGSYFKNRENELLTLTSNYLKEYYAHWNITTIGYSDIPDCSNKLYNPPLDHRDSMDVVTHSN